jgi:hypothetical protein
MPRQTPLNSDRDLNSEGQECRAGRVRGRASAGGRVDEEVNRAESTQV